MTTSGSGGGPLVFFFPYQSVSGVPVVFLRVARTLAAQHLREVAVVDYADGAMARFLQEDDGVTLIPFEDGLDLQIPDGATLIMQSVTPVSMRREVLAASTARVLFWTLYPLNLVPPLAPLGRVRQFHLERPVAARRLLKLFMPALFASHRRFVQTAFERDGLVFMDEPTYRVTDAVYDVPTPSGYLPVPAPPVPAANPKAPPASLEPITLAWLGRIEDFKTSILMYVLREAARAAGQTRPLRFLVVGEGRDLPSVVRDASTSPFFQIERLGTLVGDSLEEVLLRRVDILFAMGASALEGARLGVPTVGLDFSYRAVHRYGFRWLHHATGYSLGDVIPAGGRPGMSMQQVLEQWEANGRELSAAAHRYCATAHDPGVVSAALAAAADKTEMSLACIDEGAFRAGPGRLAYVAIREAMNVRRK